MMRSLFFVFACLLLTFVSAFQGLNNLMGGKMGRAALAAKDELAFTEASPLPLPSYCKQSISPKILSTIVTSAIFSISTPVRAATTANVESPATATSTSTVSTVTETAASMGPLPTDFGLKYDYYEDCNLVVKHMKYATLMEKGNPKLVEIASKTKDEMNEFVSYYRRSAGVNGKQSFSLLYTSINVLAGHYTSYGVKFPVPEKRRKRLLQEYNDIEKNIRKKR